MELPTMASKSCPNGTQLSERQHVTVNIVLLVVHTTIATSIYAMMSSVKYYTKFLTYLCISVEAVLLKLHAKFAPGWAFIRVNLDPIEKNRPKVVGVLLCVGTLSRVYGTYNA